MRVPWTPKEWHVELDLDVAGSGRCYDSIRVAPGEARRHRPCVQVRWLLPRARAAASTGELAYTQGSGLGSGSSSTSSPARRCYALPVVDGLRQPKIRSVRVW